ncbi:MAG: hypothetical protein R3190_12025 [Thermoanaerobaculia bacterium]|nr:hypothetical protein [Thermoanaerobaculia bacterium]
MSEPFCNREAEVLAVVRTGEPSLEVSRHLEGCAVCRDAVLVESYLSALGDGPVDWQPAPAGQLWWRAERRAREEALERATRPITLVRQAAWALAALGVTAGLVRGWPLVRGWLEQLVPEAPSGLEGLGAASVDPLLAVATLLLTLLVFGIGVAWAEQ